MTRVRKPARRITCSNCDRPDQPHRGHGWCFACYSRWHRAGRPDSGPPAVGDPQLIDEVAVELAVKGARPWLTPRERRLAVAELRMRGLSLRETAERIGCSARTVERHVAALKNGS